jgi:hypothetical protein
MYLYTYINSHFLALTFGGCMMGGEYLVNSVEDFVDPLLEGAKMPTLKGIICLYACLYVYMYLYVNTFVYL